MSNSFKKQCIKLRLQDHTLNEIVQITGHPKTSVYFHIKNIPLSDDKLRCIHDFYRNHIIQYNTSRKGVSKRGFAEIKNWDEYNVRLISHLLFDGEISNGRCVYNNRSKSLVDRVKSCMQSTYKYKPRERVLANGVTRIGYYNVALSEHLKNKSKLLLSEIGHLPKNLQRIFLQAFFDDEGSINFDKKIVRGYQKSVPLLKIINTLLKKFNIESRIDSKYYEIVISKKENLTNFKDEIGFSKGVCVNGARKNSIWKKSLEKRKILQMVLDSYNH